MRRGIRWASAIVAACLLTVGISAAPAELAADLLGKTGRNRGICAIIGGDGKLALALALARNGEFLVYARLGEQAALAPTVAAARQNGLLNRKLYVDSGPTNVIPLADNYADLLVVHASCNMPREEIMRALSPGGRAWILTDGAFAALPAKVLPRDSDDWTHWFYGPDNNPVSSDAALKWPLLLQWLAKPYDGAQPKVTVVAAGRAFCATGEAYATYYSSTPGQKADAHMLKAINVFNGQVLWERKLPVEDQVGRPAFIATAGTFYMIERHQILCLDPETGAEQKVINLGGEKRMPKWIALQDDVLYVMLGAPPTYGPKWRMGQKYPIPNTNSNERYSPDGSLRKIWGFGDEIVAYDLKAGKTLWSHREAPRDIDARQIAMRDRRVFFGVFARKVTCLDCETGDVVWENESEDLRNALAPSKMFRDHPLSYPRSSLICGADVVLVSHPGSAGNAVLSVKDGRLLWKTDRRASHCFFDGGKLHMIGRPTAFRDPLTGAIGEPGINASGCGPILVSKHGYFGRHGMVFDRAAGQKRSQHTFRGGCWQDCIPANGLLVTAPYVCGCNYSLRGWNVQAPVGAFKFNVKATEAERLHVHGKTGAAPFPQTAEDWPTHRAGNTRSGFLPVDIAAQGKLLWTAKASAHGMATPAVAVGGAVFVAGDDGLVRSLAAADGKVQWEFPTTGRIHAAPALAEGCLYVGSADGFIYALEAATGRLLWRFRAAPAERRIMTYGHLSSTWPVNTGVLVADGVAYAGAGLMDSNGTHVYALDAATGKIKWQNNTSGHLNGEQHKGVLAHGSLTIGKGKLWMCAGSSCAIASFDLADGKCTIPSHANGTGRNGNRGREIGLFADELIIQGGQPLHLDQAGERVMRSGCEMTFTRTHPDGRMAMPPVIPFVSNTALPVWDGQGLLTPHAIGRTPRIACLNVAPLQAWLAAVQTSYQEQFQKRQSWQPVAVKAAGEDLAQASKVPGRRAPVWEKEMRRDAPVYALALTKNAVIATLSPGVDRWKIVAMDRAGGTELWSQPLPVEPLFNGLCVNRKGHVLVTLTDGRILCLGATE